MLKKGPQVSFEVYLETEKFLSHRSSFSFIGSILGLILLMILWELGLRILIGIVDYMKGYNFRLDCLHL